MKPLYSLTCVEAASGIASGNITSEALVESCLERIFSRESQIKAWEYLDPEKALKEARILDRSPRKGLLHGVPVGIKDIIDTCDMPTSYGSKIYAGYRSKWDAACVAMLREAGAVILGKTVTTELALFTPGKTVNPHNPAHTPGGSSSGSAAAVADMMVPIALGTQTAGSTIRPASYCGVLGYKPTYGQFPVAGIKIFSQTLDTLGIFSRSIEDLALLRAVFVGSPASLKELENAPSIGFCRTPQWPYATSATSEALENTCKQMEKAGAKVSEFELPGIFTDLAAAQEIIQLFEGRRCYSYELTQHRDQLSKKFLEIFLPEKEKTYNEYIKALDLAAKCRAQLDALFKSYDILLVPSTPGEAPYGLESTGNPIFSRMWTLLHTPCITLPGYSGPNGLPVGVQVIGATGKDDKLLSAAAWIQRRRK